MSTEWKQKKHLTGWKKMTDVPINRLTIAIIVNAFALKCLHVIGNNKMALCGCVPAVGCAKLNNKQEVYKYDYWHTHTHTASVHVRVRLCVSMCVHESIERVQKVANTTRLSHIFAQTRPIKTLSHITIKIPMIARQAFSWVRFLDLALHYREREREGGGKVKYLKRAYL